MGIAYNPRTVTDGLVLCLDAANIKSYNAGISTTAWNDLSGRGNTGTLTNGPTYDSENGGGFVFDGSNDVLTVANSTSLQDTFSTNSFSITSVSKATSLVYPRSSFPFWIQTYQLNGTWAIANRGMSSGDGALQTSYTIEVNNGGTYFAGSVNHTVELSTPYVRTIVIDRSNGFTFKYYVNGVFLGETGSASITGSIYDSGGFQFGNMYGWTFNGTLYNLFINSKALSSAEVQQNFNCLRGRFGI